MYKFFGVDETKCAGRKGTCLKCFMVVVWTKSANMKPNSLKNTCCQCERVVERPDGSK